MTFIKVDKTIFQLEHVCVTEYIENVKVGPVLYLWLTNGQEIRLTNEDADYVWNKIRSYLSV